MSTKEKPTVGILAFTCQPGRGSEYEVGWRWSLAVPDAYECVVLTRRACWNAIPGDEVEAEGHRVKRWAGRVYRSIDFPFVERLLRGRTFMRTHFILWQVLVLIHLVLHRRRYDFVHPVSFVSVWMPSLSAFSPQPVIWGPLGTNYPTPSWYSRGRRLEVRVRAWAWHIVTQVSPRFNPLLWMCQRRAFRMIAINDHIRSLIHPSARARALIHPAIGVSEEMLARRARPNDGTSRTIVFVGRYLTAKLPEVALAAGRLVVEADPEARFVMVGERLPELLEDPGHDRVEILDHVPQERIWDLMRESRALLFPSMEGSGLVSLEAMCHGTPVVCLENSGPAFFAGDEAGVVCPLGESEAETARGLADGCLRLLRDDALWAETSARALRRVERYTWDHAEVLLDEIYADLLRNIAPDQHRHAVLQSG